MAVPIPFQDPGRSTPKSTLLFQFRSNRRYRERSSLPGLLDDNEAAGTGLVGRDPTVVGLDHNIVEDLLEVADADVHTVVWGRGCYLHVEFA